MAPGKLVKMCPEEAYEDRVADLDIWLPRLSTLTMYGRYLADVGTLLRRCTDATSPMSGLHIDDVRTLLPGPYPYLLSDTRFTLMPACCRLAATKYLRSVSRQTARTVSPTPTVASAPIKDGGYTDLNEQRQEKLFTADIRQVDKINIFRS